MAGNVKGKFHQIYVLKNLKYVIWKKKHFVAYDITMDSYTVYSDLYKWMSLKNFPPKKK